MTAEIGSRVDVAGLGANYLEAGSGTPVVLIHGSGPGVTAWANWRGAIPVLAEHFRVLAPDITGFGYTDHRPDGVYTLDTWVDFTIGFIDAVGVEQAHLVGNSFGGALALAVTADAPQRVGRLVLMGSVGLKFELTEALDAVWGYQPSEETMGELLRLFAHDQTIVTDELVRSRFEASVRPGFQEAYSSLFPAPRQRWVDALATPEDRVAEIEHETLIVHGRDDRVIPVETSIRLNQLISGSQLHVFGECGHWTQIEQAGRFTSLVRDFLLEAGDIA